LYFSYEDSKKAITRVEADKAASAAASIDRFIQQVVADLDGVARAPTDPDPAGRLQDFGLLLQRQRVFNELAYLDANGRDCVHAYSLEINELSSRTCESDRSSSPEFLGARAARQYLGEVTFGDRDARPHMTIAVAEQSPGQGVIVADVDLGTVLDAIEQARIGEAGYAYAVNAEGELIA